MPLRQQAVLFRTAHHSDALEVELARRNIPFVKFGGLRFLEAAHVKDALACLRWAENPRDSLAGFRVAQLLPGMGPRLADALVRHLAGARFALPPALASFDPPAAARADWPAFAELFARLATRPRRGRRTWAWCAAGTSRTSTRIYDDARARLADLEQLEQLAAAAPSRERFLSDLTLDPPAGDRRRGGRAAPRRGLPDPVDDPLGEGPGMGQRVRAVRRRRLHPVGPGDGHARRDRGRAPPAVRRDDAREELPRRHPPAALLHPPAAPPGRSPRVHAAHALHPRRDRRQVRASSRRPRTPTRRAAARARRAAHRRRRPTARDVGDPPPTSTAG